MKNDRLKQELNRELQSVRVSRKLKQQILADAAESRMPKRKRGSSFSPLYAAAALVLVLCLTAGALALRQEIPDRSANVLSSGTGKRDEGTVWVCDRDGSYHADVNCCGSSGARSVRLEEARAEGRKGCCLCIEEGSAAGADLVWMTSDSVYYHQNRNCSGMLNSMGVLEIEAQMFGKYACPVCLDGIVYMQTPLPTGKVLIRLDDGEVVSVVSNPSVTMVPDNYYETDSGNATLPPLATPEPTVSPVPEVVYSMPMPTAAATLEPTVNEGAAPLATPEPTEAPVPEVVYSMPMPTVAATLEPAVNEGAAPRTTPEPTAMELTEDHVWIAAGDNHYHANKHCSGMDGAWPVWVEDAILMNRIPCDVCTERTIWKTEEGLYWHRAKNCSGMENAQAVVLDPGERSNCEACPTCMEGGFPVWMTDYGTLYHWDEHCSGMEDAKQIMQSEANGLPCPICLTDLTPDYSRVTYEVSQGEAEQMQVWFDKSIYYHATEACSGLTDAQSASEAEALSYGKVPCMQCLPGRGTPQVEYAVMDGPVAAFQTKTEIDYAAYGADGEADDRNLVWLADGDIYYHADKYCSDMENAEGCPLMEALESGNMPCPLCSKQLEPVWAVENAEYFHLLEDCSGMMDAKRMTGSEAVAQGMKLCPICWEEMRLLILAAGA